MANRKISDLTALTAPATGDLLPIVDISEPAAADKNKKITYGELLASAPDGSAAAPSFSFDSDPDSGLYSAGANQVAISTNGTGRLFVDASGNISLGQASSALQSAGTGLTIYGSANSEIKFLNSTTGATATDGTALVSDSVNFSINNREAGNIIFGTSNAERMRIDSSGNVGIGTSAPGSALDVRFGTSPATDNGVGANTLRVWTSSALAINTGGAISLGGVSGAGSSAFGQIAGRKINATSNDYSGYLQFATNDSGGTMGERMRIDASGRLLVGTSTARVIEPYGLGSDGQTAHTYESVGDSAPGPGIALGSSSVTDRFGPYLYLFRSRGGSVGSNTIVSSGDNLGTISFAGADGTDVRTRGAAIYAEVDGTPGANDMPGRIVLSTTSDGAATPTERMRITSGGDLLLGTTGTSPLDTSRLRVFNPSGSNQDAVKVYQASSPYTCYWARIDSTSSYFAYWVYNGSVVGNISTNGTSTAYNTSSDYRLKENISPLVNATDRVNQLQVHRFNFISDPGKTIDGFIAHEAQAVVPECVTGEKDAIDDEGNPIYQGIDQSKLVPLLTAALQEAIAKIEALETRLSALEGV